MPKNIVLLSDGTGNSAAKLFKTNVWRVYDAIDLRDPATQVAYYDDGVGTSTFRPLALLGGAIGFGLKRNVLRLYRFLCEQYEPGDRIYAFGFSRGAFTIRVLVALVAHQGIIRVRADKYAVPPLAPPAPVGVPSAAVAARAVAAGAAVVDADAVEAAGEPAPQRTTMTASELRRLAKRAYRQYRRRFDQTTWVVRWALTLGRILRDAYFRWYDRRRGRTPYTPERNHHLGQGEITFVGLWDTVDAYGLPIDELTEGVNRWLWPLSLPNFTLSDKVGKACHALSLDDERHTFHPVLWDESAESQRATHIKDERISQVWFAGVHANVGGGYPNDALSAVSLDWMCREARRQATETNLPLLFLPNRLADWTDRRDPLGAMYDSRRGLAAYYRYNPRRIEYLTNSQEHEREFFGGKWPMSNPTIEIRRPKIHESVFARIQAAPDFYAPIGLPRRYAVVTEQGDILDGADNPYEKSPRSAERAEAQEVCWNLVWCRRLAYFAALIVTLALVAWPLREGAEAVSRIAANGGGLRLIEFIGGFLPEAASHWVQYYAAAPLELAAGLAALGAIMWAGRKLQFGIRDRMHTIWRYVRAPRRHPDLRLPGPGILFWLSWLRRQPVYHGVFAVFRRIVVPHTFGPLVLLCVLAALNRAVFEAFNLTGATCATSARPAPVGSAGVPVVFKTSAFCAATGLLVERGARYELTATFDRAVDSSVPVTRADGFSVFAPDLTWAQRVLFAVASPFKRLWSADWFGIVTRVGDVGVEQIPLGAGATTFTARNTGELFLFVNDALVPIAWGVLYTNNDGSAVVTIRRLD